MRWISFLFLFSFNIHAEITPVRKKQLDSIVSNISKEVIRNLDSLHNRLHVIALSDEERVFMFYGLFATHFKYDDARKNSKTQPEYTAEYTAYKRSGVCRDFAALFKELCNKSKIQCVIALGRIKDPLMKRFSSALFRTNRLPNHAWNIVKFNGKWHLMDPTWSTVLEIQKIYEKDKSGRKIYKGKIKIPSRTYYDSSPEFFYSERNVVHPAFYLSEKIYSYKTSRKKIKKRMIIQKEYNYNPILDSLSFNENYQFSKAFTSQVKGYSGKELINYYLLPYWQFLDLKRTPDQKLKEEDCLIHLKKFETLLNYVEKENGIKYHQLFKYHSEQINKYVLRLKKITTS